MSQQGGQQPTRTERTLQSRILRLFLLLAIGIVALGSLFVSTWLIEDDATLALVNLISFSIGVGSLIIAIVYLRVSIFVPLEYLTAWAMRRRKIDLGDGLPGTPDTSLLMVSRRIAILSEELRNMRDLLDDDEYRQTQMLAQKSRSLQVLYDVSASINIFNDLDDLLTRFLHTLIDVVNARAATVRLLDSDDNAMRLVASVGLDDEELLEESRHQVQAGDVKVEVEQTDLHDSDDDGGDVQRISVPLRYHGKTLGVYNLMVAQLDLERREDFMDLLTSIGRHLGMAIEKVRVDSQAQRLHIMQERNQLAHELHDSLAQTLASMRFQIQGLEDTLHGNKPENADREVHKLRQSLEEANLELRGLLAHFRAPIDLRGLMPALEDIVGRFRRETGIVTFFQKECLQAELPASLELQILRIVQESLANIRKHSQAHAVRILFRCDGQGGYHVLVEDDGIGLKLSDDSNDENHFGLQILSERAARLGGELVIDSEPGEGTRIELSFRHSPDAG